jgi:two-component system, NtrC family, sensor histidine kinase HydH
MLEFTTGLIVGITGVLTVWFLLKKKTRQQKPLKNEDGRLEQLSRLTGQIAHEIKNPLSTIKVNLKLIAEQLTEAGTKPERNFAGAIRKIGVVEKEADRLEHILNDFLRYVGKTELLLAAANINSLISDMIDFYMPQAHSNSVTIRQGLASEPIVCKIDADMIKQVVLNLFINAQQAMTGGGDLMIRTQRQGAFGVIQISDTGSGIEASRLGNLFDAYYSSRPAGSGLGLATVKKIIEMHGGTINVNSELGKGTLFIIKLPMSDSK